MGQASPARITVRALASTTLALALVSCGEAMDPVVPDPADGVALAPGGSRPLGTQVKVRRLMLDGDLFEIEGAPKAFAFEVDNSGAALAGVRVEATLVQGMASRLAASFIASCPGAVAGGLPQGTCTMEATATASNSAPGTGTLMQGDAQFVVTILQDGVGGATVLGSRKTGVALVPEPQPPGGDPAITDVTFPTTSELILNGPNVSYVAELSNPTGTPLGEVFLQGMIEQGGQSYGAGGVNVQCAPDFADAVLPAGTCTVVWTARAFTDPSGNGPAPGPADFVLTLNQGFDPNPAVELDRFTVPVTIVAGPTLTSVAFPTVPLVIDGDRVSYDFTVSNPTSTTYTGILFNTMVVQGATAHAAGGTSASCPIDVQVLPPGSCTMTFTAGASNSSPGTGTFVQGPATFVIIMVQAVGNEQIELDRMSVTIELVPGT